MKIKRNYPTKRQPKGKMYAEYLEVEILKGNIAKNEAVYWIRVNEEQKKNPTIFDLRCYGRTHRTSNRLIPTNA